MTPSLLPDDDAFADRDEDPRSSLGYDTTTAPRLTRRPAGGETHWTFAEVAGPARDAGPIGGAKTCADKPKGCGQSAPVLHADPRSDHPARVICGTCAGAVLRERVGWAKAGDPAPSKRGGR